MNTGSIKTIYHSLTTAVFSLILGIVFVLTGCGGAAPAISEGSVEEDTADQDLTEGNVVLSGAQLASYGKIEECLVKEDKQTVRMKFSMPDIPKSDDPMIYLFAFELYEDCEFTEEFDEEPLTSVKKATDW